MAYKLDLPPSSRIHPTFHVSCLKKKIRIKTQSLSTLLLVNNHREMLPKPEAIVDRRIKKNEDRVVIEVLMQWSGTKEEDCSWKNL